MKTKFITAALLAAVVFSAVPDLYDRNRPLSIITTTWFDFIFPEEAESTARHLASLADSLYIETAELLGTSPRYRLPVVITADHEWINGYFTNYPYPRIVLYQSAIDINSALGSFKDDLYSLFLHELTHAVSLTIHGPIQKLLTSLFGSPFGLSMYTTPLNFVEGVTVSFESLDGFGRATDPLAGALIRQDLLEGRFKDFVQTMGSWDRYPGSSLYYIYGGYFSRYLQERFGMEKYARLWHRLGSGMLTRPLDDFLFIEGHFRKVYGQSLREAWVDFGESMRPQVEVLNGPPPLSGFSAMQALAGGKKNLYWADSAEGAVVARDLASGLTKKLFPTSASITRLAPDARDHRLLVSSIVSDNGYDKLAIHEWDGTRGSLQRLPYEGLRDAAYLFAEEPLDGTTQTFLAIQVRGFETSVVLVRDQNITPLLPASRQVSYASVVAGPGGWVFVLAKEEGLVSVLRFRLEDGSVSDLQRLRLPDGLGWIRYLSLHEGILRFSWDDRVLYRLVELEDGILRYQTVPLSGGVHQAVEGAGSVYHLGHFVDGKALCILSSDRSLLGFKETEAIWESLVPSSTAVSSSKDLQEKRPYSSLPWLLPRFWHPLIAGDGEGLTLAGARLYGADPIERLSGYLSVWWNPRSATPGYATGLDLDLSPLLLRFSLSDEFQAVDADPESSRAFRIAGTSLSLSRSTLLFGGGNLDFGFSSALQGWTESLDSTDRYDPWNYALAHTGLHGGFYNFRPLLSKPGLYTGYGLSAVARSLVPLWPVRESPLFGLEMQASAAIGLLGLRLSGDGGVSISEGLLYGPQGATIEATGLGPVSIPTYPVYQELSRTNPGNWHVQAEASIRPYTMEIQQAAGPLYARRLDLRTGGRTMLTGGRDRIQYNWSLFSRIELAFSPAIGSFALARPVAWVEVWFRPLDETWGLGYVRDLSF